MDYQIGEYQNSARSFNVTPTTLQSCIGMEVDDYE